MDKRTGVLAGLAAAAGAVVAYLLLKQPVQASDAEIVIESVQWI